MKIGSGKTALNRALLSGWLFGLALLFTACAEEDNPDDPGAIRDNYLGVWQVTENTGINAPQFYRVEIVAGSSDSEIIIEDLYNVSGTEVRALIDGTELTIPNQSTASITFQGSGSANADFDQISLSFTANDGTGPDNVEAILSL